MKVVVLFYVEPHVILSLNGTMSTAATISFDCSAIYSQDFGNSLKDLVTRANSAISRGQLCATTLSVTGIAGDVKFLINDNTASDYHTKHVYYCVTIHTN